MLIAASEGVSSRDNGVTYGSVEDSVSCGGLSDTALV